MIQSVCIWALGAALEPGTHVCCEKKALQCQGPIEVPHRALGSRRPHSGLLPAALQSEFYEVKTFIPLPLPEVNQVVVGESGIGWFFFQLSLNLGLWLLLSNVFL